MIEVLREFQYDIISYKRNLQEMDFILSTNQCVHKTCFWF